MSRRDLLSNINLTNTTSSYSSVYYLLEDIDIAIRCFSMFTHIVYFALVLTIKELQSKTLIFIHQVNFYGAIFSLHYCLYINTIRPKTSSERLNDILCALSECLWGSLKPLRAFSILELAVFRLTALVRFDVFRAWVHSPFRLLAPILANLVVSFSFIITLKLGLSTTHSAFLCLDGYSPVLSRAIAYFAVSSVFGILFPFSVVCLIYAYKISYLRTAGHVKRWFGAFSRKRASDMYGSHEHEEDENNNNTINNNNNKNNKVNNNNTNNNNQRMVNRKLARQVLIMNGFLLASLLSFILTNATNIFESVDYENPLRFSLRISATFFQSLVPIASIVGHAKMFSLIRMFSFSRLFTKNNKVLPANANV